MENRWDFLEWLGPDTSTTVFMRLEDAADLARAIAVSRSWRQFVIMNSFSKNLCLKICPEASKFSQIVEVNSSTTDPEVGSSTATEWRRMEREHRIYMYLLHCIVSPKGFRDCILHCIGASSTDNFPDESIENTLEPSDRVDMRPSYWSSSGQRDPGVPESLTYRLGSDLCVINEIKIQPFKAFFQIGHPIYSAKSVRFWMGHSKLSPELESASYLSDENEGQLTAVDNYVWTYISPEFPMLQENILQSFKLPRPVLCIGGVVKIELLGRVQKQAIDDLYYICVCHVQVIGRPLSPVLAVNILEGDGGSILKYFPGARDLGGWHAFGARHGQMGAAGGCNQAVLNTLLEPVLFADDGDVSGEEDSFPEPAL
ncbi:F-box protein At4g00755-like [Ananas comosus]|uniref:F-box protein n=1 Tax=Ananas comosus TaxID=4615 RepID=A0A199VPB0_ANACO|nr:F-box protein At4g00755-like [Ananas comosus]XP_020093715.1 F-box protein At4g00755-like [Ananas comosus]OAY78899.1 F-box protein [Ananas comosus]